MAGGLGSRYGGLKQVDSFGPVTVHVKGSKAQMDHILKVGLFPGEEFDEM